MNELRNGVYKDKYGTESWLLNGLLHCEYGPAVEWGNGTKEWYVYGKLHREDGPAREWFNGDKEWFINGIEYTEEEFNHWISKKELNENLHNKLEERPKGKKKKI